MWTATGCGGYTKHTTNHITFIIPTRICWNNTAWDSHLSLSLNVIWYDSQQSIKWINKNIKNSLTVDKLLLTLDGRWVAKIDRHSIRHYIYRDWINFPFYSFFFSSFSGGERHCVGVLVFWTLCNDGKNFFKKRWKFRQSGKIEKIKEKKAKKKI